MGSHEDEKLKAPVAAEVELHQRENLEQILIGIVSHDLRNPLNAIGLSAAALLKFGGLDERQLRAVERIKSATHRATRMIYDLLDLTRVREVGGLPVERDSMDMHKVAQQAIDEIKLGFAQREVVFSVNGDATGEWDADRVSQVVGTLLTNALQHSPGDSRVMVTQVGLADEVVLSVTNGGAPIAAEAMTVLFEPFHRGRGVREAGRSVGLGLFISREIVRAHGGRLEVSSNESTGTTFTAHWPKTVSQSV